MQPHRLTPRRKIVALTAAAGLVASGTIFSINSPVGAQGVTGPDFEIDGDLDQDDANFDDWETVIPGPSSLGAEGVLIPDPHSKSATDTNVFNAGGKFYDTATWTIGTGNVGAAQNELTNVAVYPVTSAASSDDDDWLVLSLERTKKQGTFALWLEFNQNTWDPDESSVPARSDDDIAVGFELSGNPEDEDDFQIAVLAFDAGGPPNLCAIDADGFVTPGSDPCPTFNGDWHYRYLGPAGQLGAIGAGEMNLVDVDPSVVAGWTSFDAQGNERALIGPFQFAEAALNLTALGIDVGCPGFGSAHAASVASLSSTADAKDLGGPQDLPITCSIAGSKYLDVNVDGAFDAGDTKISDWPMTLYLDDGDGVFDAGDTEVDSTTTDSNGDYLFTGLSDGVYHVVEGAARQGDTADDWQHQAARSTDGTVALDANGDPTIVQGIAVDSSNTSSTGNDFLNAQPPDVNVSKVAFDATYDTIDAGDDAEFTVTIGNDGPGTATSVSMSDDLPQLSTANAWAITAQTDGDCSIADDTPAAGAQQLTCTIASLASGATYSVTVAATTTGEDCGTMTNTATVSAGNEPAGNVGDENTDTATITVLCPNLTAAKTGAISYTASVSNAAGADVATADGVTLTDQLPGDLEWTVTAISAGGDVACGLAVDDVVTGGLIDCSGIELAPGASFEVSVEAAIDDATGDCAAAPLVDNQVSGSATNEASADTGDNGASAAICAVPPAP